MAIIVELIENRKKMFLVGTGLGMYKATRPNFLGGTLFPNEEEGISQSVALCDEAGTISFYDSGQVRVIEIDGVKVKDFHEILVGKIDTADVDYCPGCNGQISVNDKECPYCGLNFLVEDAEF